MEIILASVHIEFTAVRCSAFHQLAASLAGELSIKILPKEQKVDPTKTK